MKYKVVGRKSTAETVRFVNKFDIAKKLAKKLEQDSWAVEIINQEMKNDGIKGSSIYLRSIRIK